MDFRYLYTSFDGRINRKPYWLAGITLGIGLVVLSLIVVVPLAAASPILGSLAGLVLMLASLYPVVALGVKRLHDRGKSGQLMAVFIAPGLIYQIGNLLGITRSAHELAGQTVMLPNMLGSILGLLSLAVGIWALVELGIRKGSNGANAFGPDPLDSPVPQAGRMAE